MSDMAKGLSLAFRLITTAVMGVSMIDFSHADTAGLGSQSAPTSINIQPREGRCNRGNGSYPCLLTESPSACPEGTEAVLYRAATCAPCVADVNDCPCAPDLFECQFVNMNCPQS